MTGTATPAPWGWAELVTALVCAAIIGATVGYLLGVR